MFELLFFLCRFFIVMDQAAHVDALPVLRQELPVSTGLHDRMALFTAYKAFHKAGLFIDHLHHMLFF